MDSWGTSRSVAEKEKPKSKMADFLDESDCCKELDISAFKDMLGISMELLDLIYEV